MTIKEMIEAVWRWHHLGAGREALHNRTSEDLMRDAIIKRLEEIEEMRDKIELLEEVIRLENIDIMY